MVRDMSGLHIVKTSTLSLNQIKQSINETSPGKTYQVHSFQHIKVKLQHLIYTDLNQTIYPIKEQQQNLTLFKL
jgi:hypothetical protein